MAKEILLNGETYTIGDRVLTIGLDMNCFKCVTSGRILDWNEEDNIYILESEGCRTLCSILMTCDDGTICDAHNEYYVYNAKNRRLLKEQCK